MIGAIEVGGSKVVCSVGRTAQEIRDGAPFVVPTTSPDETLGRVAAWLRARDAETPLAAIGVASFGPLDLARDRITTTTPKVAWRGVDWRRAMAHAVPGAAFGLDTDTNAAGLAEWRWGAARGHEVAAYLTVGTGIGGAVVVAGRPLHGLGHPEVGHMVVPRQPGDDFAGTCPHHGNCLEGLAGGPAVARRWNQSPPPFAPDHPAWALESEYLSIAVVNLVVIAAPEIIVLGGGIMSVEGLLERVRLRTRDRLAGYLDHDELDSGIDRYLVRPGLGDSAGVVGAFALGEAALAAR